MTIDAEWLCRKSKHEPWTASSDKAMITATPFERHLSKVGTIANGPKDVFYCGWSNFRRSGAAAPSADLYGLASRDWRLVGPDMGKLGRLRRRWWPRVFWIETGSARPLNLKKALFPSALPPQTASFTEELSTNSRQSARRAVPSSGRSEASWEACSLLTPPDLLQFRTGLIRL